MTTGNRVLLVAAIILLTMVLPVVAIVLLVPEAPPLQWLHELSPPW